MAAFSKTVGSHVSLTDEGLVLGDGTTLVRMLNGNATTHLALEADRGRFTALMSVASGHAVEADVFRHVEAADYYWRRGDKALANLRLVLSDLPHLATRSDANRLALAAYLLDEGMKPDALMNELGLKLATDILKYSRDEARVPAGHGRESGEFVSSNGRIVVAGGGRPPEDDKTEREHEITGVASQRERIESGHPASTMPPAPFLPSAIPLPAGVGPGPFAGKSIPTGPSLKPNATQQRDINAIGRDTGCHTCGSRQPGTESGNFIGDHQLPRKLNPAGTPQVYFPHCQSCSRAQGGRVRHLNNLSGNGD